MTEFILRTHNLSFRYPEAGKPGIQRVTFEVPQYQITAILGANGAGKSTLLKLLDGQFTDYSGSIKLDGKEIRSIQKYALGKRIAFLPQIENIPQDINIFNYVLLGRSPYIPLWSMPKVNDWEIATKILHSLGLAKMGEIKVSRVSGGEWQRIRIARALIQEPEILLMDEPTTFLDLKHRKNILSLLKRLTKNRITILFATQDPEAAADIADNLLLMKDGKLLSLGPIEHTLNTALLSDTFNTPVKVVKMDNRSVVLK